MPNAFKKLRNAFFAQLDTSLVAESLFAQVPDIVFCIKNDQGIYISANTAFADRLGLRSINSILGKTAADIFPEHLAASYQSQDNEVMARGKEINDQLELIYTPKGPLGWHLARKIPLIGKDEKIIGLASISRDLFTPDSSELHLAGLAQMIQHIQTHFSEPLQLPDLAKIAQLTPTQLDRRMRKIFKLSTSQFIRKSRIEAAAHMLTDSDKPIIDVALDSGYGDQSAFTRQFKSTVGMTPSAYRSAYRP